MKRGVRLRAVAVALAVAGATSARAEADRAAFLGLLHDGRFEAAQQTLRRQGPPTQPDDLFFDAFTTYWRLVFDDDNSKLRTTLEQQLATTIAAAESQSSVDTGGDAALWGGSSRLLLAELRASQRRPMAAAFEAKRAKRLLESASIAGPGKTDALFGLGTYNYLADTVPSYVKGLRALLFLPKGDRKKGLEQLANASAGSRYFGLEARTLLVTIYANRHERLYGRALEERDRLLAAFPDTIASSYASARLDLSLGRNEAAIDRLARAEERAQTLGDVDPVVVRCIELLRARAELAALRPDLAEATARRALASGHGLGSKMRSDFAGLRETASRLAEGIPWSQLPAPHHLGDGAESLGALAAAHSERPLLALLAGEAQLRAGSAQDALDWFTRAATAGLPPELLPACLLRQGRAEDLLGRRPRAVALYKRAAAAPGFVAKDAAYFHLQAPYRRAP